MPIALLVLIGTNIVLPPAQFTTQADCEAAGKLVAVMIQPEMRAVCYDMRSSEMLAEFRKS